MTSLADRTIAALRANHDELAGFVPNLTPEQLTGPSGASDWTMAQVLSHLGSGAEIALAGLDAAVNGGPVPADDFNQGVWDRWNALEPQAQADGFLERNAALVETYEAVTPQQRETTQIKLGFVPVPLPLASIAGMRLNEAVLHGWDARVGVDPTATVSGDDAALLAGFLSGDLSFFLGFIAKADQLTEPAVVEVAGSEYGLVIGEAAALTTEFTDPTATFTGPLESVLRLITGRLTAAYTSDDVAVTGNVTLDDLRRVFQGF